MQYETIELGNGLWAKRYINGTWAIFRKHTSNPMLLSKEQIQRIMECETTADNGKDMFQRIREIREQTGMGLTEAKQAVLKQDGIDMEENQDTLADAMESLENELHNPDNVEDEPHPLDGWYSLGGVHKQE